MKKQLVSLQQRQSVSSRDSNLSQAICCCVVDWCGECARRLGATLIERTTLIKAEANTKAAESETNEFAGRCRQGSVFTAETLSLAAQKKPITEP